MLRKASLSIMFFCLAPTTFAGFYVGGGVGPDTANFDQRAYISKPLTTNVKDTTHLAGKGYFGTLFGGYAWFMKQFFLAAEVNANLSNDTFNSTNSEFLHQTFSKTEYRMRSSFGLSALPGYLFTDHTLFYGRVGYNNGNFQIVTLDNSIGNVSRHLSGLRYGLGIAERITEHLAVRLEYSQVLYENTKILVYLPGSNVTKKTTIAPTTSQVEFGLVYSV